MCYDEIFWVTFYLFIKVFITEIMFKTMYMHVHIHVCLFGYKIWV